MLSKDIGRKRSKKEERDYQDIKDARKKINGLEKEIAEYEKAISDASEKIADLEANNEALRNQIADLKKSEGKGK